MSGAIEVGWRPSAAHWPIFLATRLAIFFVLTSATDYKVYYDYGQVVRSESVAALYQQQNVEYPQLSVVFGACVGWVADQLPTGVERLIAARPNSAPSVGAARFQVALGLVLFAVDVGLFLLVAGLARRANPDDRGLQRWRIGLYVAATAALGPVLYDRLDLLVGAAALLALVALGSGRSILAYAVLTVGVGFKLVPAVLFPVFVLGAIARRRDRFWHGLMRETTIALLVVAAWPLLSFLLGGGERAFTYVQYHALRGPELGSVYAAPLLLAGGSEVGYSFGGYDVRGPNADAVAKASPLVVILALAIAFSIACRATWRAPASDRMSVVVAGCVLVWLTFILTNKVGSPQYLLWLAPLVPLMPIRTPNDRRWGGWFVAAALLATLIYPYLWPAVFGEPVPGRPNTWAGPTPFGFALLFLRWTAVVVLTGWLAARLANTSPGDSPSASAP